MNNQPEFTIYLTKEFYGHEDTIISALVDAGFEDDGELVSKWKVVIAHGDIMIDVMPHPNKNTVLNQIIEVLALIGIIASPVDNFAPWYTVSIEAIEEPATQHMPEKTVTTAREDNGQWGYKVFSQTQDGCGTHTDWCNSKEEAERWIQSYLNKGYKLVEYGATQ